ncbi:MAG TPA: DUF6531 domain-containing protein, partial [Pseudomonas sp.]|nr:DUF6531 domain-containing protein [Pseudomonas sp.]
MVAVVAGKGLGLFDTSLNTLGGAGVWGQGGLGQAGGQALVNASNGNLVLRFTDQQLSGLGLDLPHTRTYNVQGAYNDADGDGWRWDGERRVALDGTLNSVGSSLLRTTGDGHETRYAWNGSRYQSSEGDGAHDSLSWDAASGEWLWTDGSRRTVERYAGATGRLVRVTDASGSQIDYGYDGAGRLNSVLDASGQKLLLMYNVAGRLARLDTQSSVGGALSQRVYYTYDASGRLSQVRTDLSPADNSIADGQVYSTSYSYDGASFRIAGVSQSDGSAVAFTYVLVGGEYRVRTVSDAAGTTTFGYDTVNRRTDVSNGLNQLWSYSYDATGQLTQVQSPAVNGPRLVTGYAYDADGNLTRVTDGRGNAVTYGYDTSGNRVLERDALGTTLARVYSSANQLLNEIRYSQAATWDSVAGSWSEPPAASAQVTRYAYDSANRLRYQVSASGTVREYRYTSSGLLSQELGYGDLAYNVGALAPSAGLSEATLTTWAAARDKSRSQLSELSYDYRGNLSRRVTYASVDASGAGVLDAAAQVSEFIYSEHGQLLQTLVVRGAGRTDKTTLGSVAYDGLGRVLSQVEASGTRTYVYNGVGRTLAVTSSAGLTQTQAFDAQGRLLSLSESGAGIATRLTQYRYDAAGRLTMVQDASGVRRYSFYDEAGRLSAQVDGAGALTEYRYDAAGQKTQEIRYATLVNTSAWYDGTTVLKTLVSQVRPALDAAADRRTTYAYDDAGRLSASTDAAGFVSTYSYDGRGQLIQVQAGERISRTFYDAAGRVSGELDGEGYLREHIYNAAGQRVRVIRYAGLTLEANRASGTLAQLRPASAVLSTWYYYDAAGRQVGSVDEQQFVTQTLYDEAANTLQTIRYATPYTASLLYSTPFATLQAAVAGGAQQTRTTQYDGFGRVSQRIAPDGSVTAYLYDTAGRLVQEIQAQGTGEARSTRTRYDVLGQALGRLTGEGAARLTAGMSEAQIQGVYAGYGLTYSYDVAGRQLSVRDAAGNKVLAYYDAAGRQTHSINALGEVSETLYNAFGEVQAQTSFIDRLSGATTAGLSGGLLTTPLSALTQAMRDNAANSTTRQAYDLRGQRIGSTDAVGYLTSYGYNRHGEQTSITRTISQAATPTTTTTALSYNQRGELIGRTEDVDGLARSTAIGYDAFGRVTSRTDGRGQVSTTLYASNGRIITQKNPLNQSETTEYDAFARVLKQTDALGRVTQYSYDDAARTLTMTMPGGVTVTTTLTRHGETLSVADGNGHVTQYSYNKDGQLLTTLNALNQATTQAYDAAGRKISVTDAAGNITRYGYDAASRVISVTDAANSVTRYVLDGLGRKMRSIEAEGSAAQRITDYSYDCAAQVVSITQDPEGLKLTTTYSYDGLGRQLQVSRGTLADPQQQVTRYEFDALGRRSAERVDPDGLNRLTRYDYNGNDQVSRKIDAAGTSTWYVYDSAGRLTDTVDGLGGVTRSVYDAAGQVSSTIRYATRLAAATVAAFGDALVSVSPSANAAIDQKTWFIYDPQGRVRYSVDALNQVSETLYDATGRVLERRQYDKAIAAATPRTLADTAAALVTAGAQARSTTYVYDAAGRQRYSIDAAGAVTEHRYDANGRVIETLQYANPMAERYASPSSDLSAWEVYAGEGTISRVYDRERGEFVIALAGNAQSSGYRLWSDSSHSAWNSQATALTWDMQYAEGFGVYISVQTNKGHRYLSYRPGNAAPVLTGSYAYHSLGAVTDGKWQRISRDLQADLSALEPDAQILSVNAFLVRGSGRIGEVSLSPGTTPETLQRVLQPSANDRRTAYAYDTLGRLTHSIDPTGAVTETHYDAVGNVTRTLQYANPIQLPTVGSTNGRTLTLSGASSRLTAVERIAIDPTKTYTVRARLRQLSGEGNIYVGVITYDSSGKALTNPYTSTYSYNAARGVRLTPQMGWQVFEGSISGTTAIDVNANRNQFFEGSASAVPLLLYNYAGDTSGANSRLVEVDSLELIDTATGQVLNLNAQTEA